MKRLILNITIKALAGMDVVIQYVEMQKFQHLKHEVRFVLLHASGPTGQWIQAGKKCGKDKGVIVVVLIQKLKIKIKQLTTIAVIHNMNIIHRRAQGAKVALV